jgi:membrane-associated phospholipid phosphatase
MAMKHLTETDVPLPNMRAPIGRVAMAALCAAAVSLIWIAVVFVDRPVADQAHAAWRAYEPVFKAMTHIVDPMPLLAGVFAGGYGLAALFGLRPGPRGIVVLRIAVAVLVAITLKEQLKFVFGRTWPETWTNNNVSYIKDGVFGFFPQNGWYAPPTDRTYHSFPSGHMTIISAVAVSVALNWPKLKWLMPIPVLLVAAGMVGANYHWVSDLIAGTALGSGVALAMYRLGQG